MSELTMATLTILCDYTTQYADPIRLAAGERFTLTGKADRWDDRADWVWLWGIAVDGREGWIPAEFVEQRDPTTGLARRDYDARELTVKVGDEVESLVAAAGWHFCRAADGRVGWVPVSHMRAPA